MIQGRKYRVGYLCRNGKLNCSFHTHIEGWFQCYGRVNGELCLLMTKERFPYGNGGPAEVYPIKIADVTEIEKLSVYYSKHEPLYMTVGSLEDRIEFILQLLTEETMTEERYDDFMRSYSFIVRL